MTRPATSRYRRLGPRLRLHFHDWDGTTRPVVAVHGLLRVGADFAGLATAWPTARLLAPDVRGRGHSSWGPADDYHLGTYAADLVRWMDELGLNEVDWVGTSMGGLIGLTVTALAPGRIRKLVLNDVGPVISPEGMARIAGYAGSYPLFPSFEAAKARLGKVYAPFNLTDAALNRLVASSLREVPGGWRLHHDPHIAYNFTKISGGFDAWPLFEAAQVPMLVIRGEVSDILSDATVADMKARAKKPLLSYTEPKVGHAPLLDTPATVAVIRDFLA